MLNIDIHAENSVTELDTEIVEISDDEILFRTNRLSLSYLEPDSDIYKDRFVFSFDVSEKNYCALLLDNACIVIYDSEDNVYSIMKFNENVISTRGRDTVIKWNGDTIELITDYGITYHITKDGELLEVFRYEAITDIPNPKQITRNDYIYEMKNNNKVADILGFGNYNMLAKTSADGTEIAVFESEASLPFVAILLIVLFSGFILFGLIIISSVVVLIIVRRKLRKRFSNPGDSYLSSNNI